MSNFERRHIGANPETTKEICRFLGVKNIKEFIRTCIPEDILMPDFSICTPISENNFQQHIDKLATKNKIFKTYIGQGYYNTFMPGVIRRNVFENPEWYTAYTPYQAEISQGRMEALLNFQTMVAELTGMEIANASLLDEASACAEAMTMAKRLSDKQESVPRHKFFVDKFLYEQNKAVLETRAEPLGITIVYGNIATTDLNTDFFGGIIAYQNTLGGIGNIAVFTEKLKQIKAFSIATTDLLALTLLKDPGSFGIDIVVGNSQRLGVPLGFGGPHAAFLATQQTYIRELPGRIIGVSVDAMGNTAYRLTLQTREQHIKRNKATSNICTAQALLAILSSFYVQYHGPEGLKKTATEIHHKAQTLKEHLQKEGYQILNEPSFDTIAIKNTPSNPKTFAEIKNTALKNKTNLHYYKDEYITLSIDETTSAKDIKTLSKIFTDIPIQIDSKPVIKLPSDSQRSSVYLTHKNFNTYHSETELLRYIKYLTNKDLSLCHAMIPLGSCTMKLNPTTAMLPLSDLRWNGIHPYVPKEQTEGYQILLTNLADYLKKITGFAGVSFQPNSGAQGEYAGLMIIRAYHKEKGATQRNTILIPVSAHGTNPASAALSGMDIQIVQCSDNGEIDIVDLESKAQERKDTLAGLMITYPSTYGLYEENIKKICDIIHKNGGLVYMDGANMNAQVGFTSPAFIGMDICHLNLHKTFAIPHGGGGPGAGPICVAEHLVPFLPKDPLSQNNINTKAIGSISGSNYGSALILIITYAYIRMLGTNGLKNATAHALLNANYIKEKIKSVIPILFNGKNGKVAHELIIDLRGYKKTIHIDAIDVAKRLIDFGFHPPTVAFPIPGTLMIEPTESESKEELDRFCNALITIAEELSEIERGLYPTDNNVIKNAPHPISLIAKDEWDKPYTRKKAAFPSKNLEKKKFWPAIARIDDTYGDRNLMCHCPL